MDEKNNFAPYFRGEELKYDSDTGNRIFEAKQNPNLYVKEFGTGKVGVEENYKLIRQNFSDFMPQTALVESGKNAETSQFYLIIEKISKEKDNKYHTVFCRELDEFLSQVVDFFFKNKAAFSNTDEYHGIIPDINTSNLIFGTTQSNSEPKLYLIDYSPMLQINALGLKGWLKLLAKPHLEKYDFPKIQEAVKKLDQIDPYITK